MNNVILVSILGYFAIILKEIPMKIINCIIVNNSFSISVTSDDRESYNNLNKWLFSLNKNTLKNNINVKRKRGIDNSTDFSINYGSYIFKIGLCVVFLDKQLIENQFDVTDKISLRIVGRKQQIISQLKEIMQKDNSHDMIRVHPLPDIWFSCLKNKKNFDDIFLEQKDLILEHLEKWKRNKPIYKKHGIPYKTGILLHGRPGTGKSTTARAIASCMNYNIHTISIKSYENEEKLLRKILDIPANTVILFEDIDCILGSREEQNTQNENRKALLGTVLNILDGMISPENVIFIATTNYIERLDDALIRDGRFDLKVKVDNISQRLAEDMCKRFNAPDCILEDESFPINPSYLQNKIINYITKY